MRRHVKACRDSDANSLLVVVCSVTFTVCYRASLAGPSGAPGAGMRPKPSSVGCYLLQFQARPPSR
jgi:hypothetical protein